MANLLTTSNRRSERTDQRRSPPGDWFVTCLLNRNPNRSAGALNELGITDPFGRYNPSQMAVHRNVSGCVNLMDCGMQNGCWVSPSLVFYLATGNRRRIPYTTVRLAGTEISHCVHRTQPTGISTKTSNQLPGPTDPILSGK